MKLTAVLLITTLLQVSGRGLAQKVNFVQKDVTIKQVFEQIYKQTGYSILWTAQNLQTDKKINANFHNASLDEVMRQCLDNLELDYAIEDKSIVVSKRQQVPPDTPGYVIRGKVVSGQDGKPLAGVSVSSGQKGVGTITDEQGNYILKTRGKPGKISFSFTGFVTQEISDEGRPVINVSLTVDDKDLSEVVITAFGLEKQKKSIGYATQVIKGEELTVARETNVVNSLKGKVAGVFVSPSNTGDGGSTFVNIRGASSFLGNNQPLYVVDGVPIDNQTIDAPDMNNDLGANRDYGDGIGNILPDDIETITILKGPNAAALYGSRGAKGVILITTKKGKIGKKAVVDVNSNAVMEKANILPVHQTVWGPGYSQNTDGWNTVDVNGEQVLQLPNWTGGDTWGPKYDGRPIVLQEWPDAGVLKFSAQPADELSKFYQTGSTFTNSIGVSGANEKTNYRLSLSDLSNNGIYPTSQLNRQTISLRVGANATPNLYIEAKVNYIRQAGQNRPGNGLSINTLQASLARIPSFISLNLLKNYITPDGQSNNWTDGRPFNPYWILNEMPSNDSRDRTIGYVLAKYKLTSWLTLQGRSGTDFYTDLRFSHIAVNTPTGYDNLRQGEVNSTEIHVKEENSDVLLTAAGKLSRDFSGTISVGANHLNRREDINGAEGFNLNIPGLYNILNAQLVYPRSGLVRKQINSVYFTGQLGYQNYLFLDITGRNDWSSTLGANNYSFFYPSVSTSFVFTDALRVKSKMLSYGKIRVSYAQAGNDADPYQTQIGYNLSSASFAGQQFASIQSNIPLTNLKNELTGSFEVGTELKLFNNRVGLDFTYYNASTRNQILGINISAVTGFASKLINAGEIRNHGVEILLTATPVKSKDFSWDVTINFSRNRSQVVSLAPGIPNLTLISNGAGPVSIEARPGQPYGNIVGYAFKRTPDGAKWLSSTGAYQRDDTMSVLGNIQPDFLAGITNALSYKGFTLSALVDFRIGGQIFSNSKQTQMYSGTGKFTENGDNLVADGEIQDGSGKFSKSTLVVDRMDYYTAMGWGNISQAYVISADYVALREVTFGYRIGNLLRNTVLKTATLSLVGRNLLYLYRDPQFKQMGIAPEAAFSATTTAQGFESPGVPSTRSMGVNLAVTF